MAIHSKTVIYAALAGNVRRHRFAGSAAVSGEAVHSTVDTG